MVYTCGTSKFSFRGDNYKSKNARVVILAHNVYSTRLTFLPNINKKSKKKSIEIVECTRMSLLTDG